MANGVELDDLRHLCSSTPNELQESSAFLFPLSLQERIHDPTLFNAYSKPPPERRSKYCTFSKESFQNYIYTFIPIFKWARDYNRTMIRPDLIAGLTIAVMTIPQGMAYASLATLPPVYGLYAALVPLYVYALFGTSRYTTVGMVAVNAILVASTLKTYPEDERVMVALTLSFITGLTSVLLGVLGAGFVVGFISPAVILGFTTGTAGTIAISQLEPLLGVKGVKNDIHIIQIFNVLKMIPNTKWLALVNGIVCLIILLTLKRMKLKVPGSLVVTVLSTVSSLLIHKYTSLGNLLPIVGTVPSGLPSFTIPDFSYFTELIVPALILALIGFIQTVSIAIAFHEDANYNQELVALGLIHVFGALCGSPDTTGGFSRSAVNKSTGAVSQISNIFAATVVLISLVGLTSLFYHIPISTLSVIIIASVLSLFKFGEYMVYYKTRMYIEGSIAVITCIIVFSVSIIYGLGVGVVLALIRVIYASSRGNIIELWYCPEKHVWRDKLRYSMEGNAMKSIPHIRVLRFDNNLWFANMLTWKNASQALIIDDDQYVVFDFAPVNSIDLSAMLTVWEFVDNCEKGVLFANVKGSVRDVFWNFKKSDWVFFANVDCAVAYAMSKIASRDAGGRVGTDIEGAAINSESI